MGSIIRSTRTVFYSLLYLNSRQGFHGLKFMYSVISVIVNSLPSNTKYRESTRYGQSAIRRIPKYIYIYKGHTHDNPHNHTCTHTFAFEPGSCAHICTHKYIFTYPHLEPSLEFVCSSHVHVLVYIFIHTSLLIHVHTYVHFYSFVHTLLLTPSFR